MSDRDAMKDVHSPKVTVPPRPSSNRLTLDLPDVTAETLTLLSTSKQMSKREIVVRALDLYQYLDSQGVMSRERTLSITHCGRIVKDVIV